jgi:hypothetical protein
MPTANGKVRHMTTIATTPKHRPRHQKGREYHLRPDQEARAVEVDRAVDRYRWGRRAWGGTIFIVGLLIVAAYASWYFSNEVMDRLYFH